MRTKTQYPSVHIDLAHCGTAPSWGQAGQCCNVSNAALHGTQFPGWTQTALWNNARLPSTKLNGRIYPRVHKFSTELDKEVAQDFALSTSGCTGVGKLKCMPPHP